MPMELIETIELTASAASIEFTSIPQDGVDLLLVVSARSDNNSVSVNSFLRFNADSSLIYATRMLRGNGSAADSYAQPGEDNLFIRNFFPALQVTSNTFGNAQYYISNYTSTVAKSISSDVVTENNATESYQQIAAGSYGNSSGITSLAITTNGNFVQYSTASLYKIS